MYKKKPIDKSITSPFRLNIQPELKPRPPEEVGASIYKKENKRGKFRVLSPCLSNKQVIKANNYHKKKPVIGFHRPVEPDTENKRNKTNKTFP